MVVSLFTLAPRLIGGSLFPSDDSPFVFITVSAPPGTDQSTLQDKANYGGVSIEDRLV